MSLNAFLALLVYAFVTSITPGPNNLMLLASGVNFGIARTVPHMLGISIGFLVLLLAVGFGLGAALTAFPALHSALKIAGAAYLLYLAWKIAMSRSVGDGKGAEGRPMRFIDAAAFQWVNPKAWVMAITHGCLHQSRPPVRFGSADLDRFHHRQPAQRLRLGRLRHGAARLPVGSDAAEMVQHRHGPAACGNAVADAPVS
jgi:4-amino-4-deoxy-L-arabinose transferase-like glycosyltransferase